MSKVIGLTGPIGAGKNEVARTLRRRGALVIDTDEVAHSLYSTQSPVWHELVKAFGAKILKRGGMISRKKLGEIVFSDKRKLRELNRIVHPALKEAIVKMTGDQKTGSGDRIIVINAAVLKGIGLIDQVDEIWVVMAAKATRMKRLVRAGLSKEEARKRIDSQVSQKEYLKMADVVIGNEGTLKQLNAKVQACLQL
jgi:dephospho-CoA kinase